MNSNINQYLTKELIRTDSGFKYDYNPINIANKNQTINRISQMDTNSISLMKQSGMSIHRSKDTPKNAFQFSNTSNSATILISNSNKTPGSFSGDGLAR